MKERRREKGREEEDERYENYDFVWIVWMTMILYGKVWIFGLFMDISLFHFQGLIRNSS